MKRRAREGRIEEGATYGYVRIWHGGGRIHKKREKER